MKGRIAILTGGGDVPGLNPAIMGISLRALTAGYEVIGIRRGWKGLVDLIPDSQAENSEHYVILAEAEVRKASRTGGTILHTSRTLPSRLPQEDVPRHLQNQYSEKVNDLTPDILKNLDFLKIDFLIAIGGDDTLSYAKRLHDEGVKVIGIPKTMDNDVAGTDYCIGFSTSVSRTVELVNQLRTTTGSHERFLVVEVFGRYAGFTAIVPAMAGVCDRCVIPEYPFDIEELTALLVDDRKRNPSRYSVAIVSEGATMINEKEMHFESNEKDQYGHRKLGGVGDKISALLKETSPKFNDGQKIDVIYQPLRYLMRSGVPDAFDSIVPIIFGNLAMDLVLAGKPGRLVNLNRGVYGDISISIVTSEKKRVDVDKFYEPSQLRPKFGRSLFPFYL